LQHFALEHGGFYRENTMPRKPKATSGIGVLIGRNIKIARTRLGITQSHLAEALAIENVTVSRIETGAQLPSIDRLEEIAKVLKTSVTALLADTSKNSGYAELLAEVMTELPAREKDFLYGFVSSYATHFRAGKKK
jgi:transcriptional regulator with XRE-family HTH domain